MVELCCNDWRGMFVARGEEEGMMAVTGAGPKNANG